MSQEQKHILNMLSEGKITVDEASRLLEALGDETSQMSSRSICPTGTAARVRSPTSKLIDASSPAAWARPRAA